MKHISLPNYLFLLGLLFFSSVLAGQHHATKTKTSVAKVKLMEGKKKGYFHHIDATSIYLASSKASLQQGTNLIQLPISSIQKLQLKRKGGARIGALSGMVAGGLTGLLLGRATGANDDCSPTTNVSSFTLAGWQIAWSHSSRAPYPCGPREKGKETAIKGALVGAALGMIIGSSKRTFHIGGRKSKARLQEEAIKKFEYKQ